MCNVASLQPSLSYSYYYYYPHLPRQKDLDRDRTPFLITPLPFTTTRTPFTFALYCQFGTGSLSPVTLYLPCLLWPFPCPCIYLPHLFALVYYCPHIYLFICLYPLFGTLLFCCCLHFVVTFTWNLCCLICYHVGSWHLWHLIVGTFAVVCYIYPCYIVVFILFIWDPYHTLLPSCHVYPHVIGPLPLALPLCCCCCCVVTPFDSPTCWDCHSILHGLDYLPVTTPFCRCTTFLAHVWFICLCPFTYCITFALPDCCLRFTCRTLHFVAPCPHGVAPGSFSPDPHQQRCPSPLLPFCALFAVYLLPLRYVPFFAFYVWFCPLTHLFAFTLPYPFDLPAHVRWWVVGSLPHTFYLAFGLVIYPVTLYSQLIYLLHTHTHIPTVDFIFVPYTPAPFIWFFLPYCLVPPSPHGTVVPCLFLFTFVAFIACPFTLYVEPPCLHTHTPTHSYPHTHTAPSLPLLPYFTTQIGLFTPPPFTHFAFVPCCAVPIVTWFPSTFLYFYFYWLPYLFTFCLTRWLFILGWFLPFPCWFIYLVTHLILHSAFITLQFILRLSPLPTHTFYFAFAFTHLHDSLLLLLRSRSVPPLPFILPFGWLFCLCLACTYLRLWLLVNVVVVYFDYLHVRYVWVYSSLHYICLTFVALPLVPTSLRLPCIYSPVLCLLFTFFTHSILPQFSPIDCLFDPLVTFTTRVRWFDSPSPPLPFIWDSAFEPHTPHTPYLHICYVASTFTFYLVAVCTCLLLLLQLTLVGSFIYICSLPDSWTDSLLTVCGYWPVWLVPTPLPPYLVHYLFVDLTDSSPYLPPYSYLFIPPYYSIIKLIDGNW